MCLAKAYEAVEGDRPIASDISYMIIDGNQIELQTLLGEKMVFQGKVLEIDFLKSRVQLEKM